MTTIMMMSVTMTMKTMMTMTRPVPSVQKRGFIIMMMKMTTIILKITRPVPSESPSVQKRDDFQPLAALSASLAFEPTFTPL